MNINSIQDYFQSYPKGASHYVRDAIRQTFFTRYGNPFLSEAKWPCEINILDAGFTAIGMLESCFAYDGIKQFYKQHSVWQNNRRCYFEQYKEKFINAGGSESDYEKLIQIHTDYLQHCKVVYGSGSDDEGNIYNSIQERKDS